MSTFDMETILGFAIEALSKEAADGTANVRECRKFLTQFGGTQYLENVYEFEEVPYRVELLISKRMPDYCVLWKTKK